ncbi:MAG: ABC transporter ATP-binding protein [Chloroflexota bacterium]
MAGSLANDKVIIVKNLVKKFGDFTAVDQIKFEVNRGEIFGFLGPNGSGKTTTIRMMLGLLQPTEGEINILGIDVNGSVEGIRRKVGYMSQRFSLYNDLTVVQNLKFYGAAYGLDESKLNVRIGESLEMAGLLGKEQVKTRDLSGGWRQRLALSVAIIHQPEVIFLDEPTAGVDPVSRRTFWDLLYQLVTGGVTVFVTTHYMDEAEHCHRLAFIQEGRLIAYGSPEEIKQDTIKGRVFEIGVDHPGEALALLKKVQKDKPELISEVELYGSLIHLFSDSNQNSERKIKEILKRSKVQVNYMEEIDPSLEDVFISCVHNNKQS